MNQMVLLADAPKRRNPREGMCKCGHEELAHDLPKRHRTRKQCGRCGCPRFRSRMRKKVPLVVPEGAEVLMRPDTVSDTHPMGWRLITVGEHEHSTVTAYLHQLRTRTPNEYNRRQQNERFRAQKAKEQERAVASAQTAMDLGHDVAPDRVKIVRVSCRPIRDDDNLVSALKWVRDGIADAFEIDDSCFSIGGANPEKIPLFYEQRPSGKGGVYGVEIVCDWFRVKA